MTKSEPSGGRPRMQYRLRVDTEKDVEAVRQGLCHPSVD